ncbi:MAG TPA: GGDEF domain-containing protein, partial [Acetobacteraceae bacterium]|nr:GGDEF domain-containing protein [Acetobacteraceae bacterium]
MARPASSPLPCRSGDPLTGLADGRQLEMRLHDLSGVEGLAAGHALLLLELDRFKAVNDTFGHAAGDGLLKTFAGRLRAALGPADLAARQGGDGFAVLLAPRLEEEVLALARRLVELLSRPYLVGGRVAHTG